LPRSQKRRTSETTAGSVRGVRFPEKKIEIFFCPSPDLAEPTYIEKNNLKTLQPIREYEVAVHLRSLLLFV
jgi:hypothetical protein